ncbi:substrate-binding periplasmic protein [Aestuariispira insulae]|uniref:Amino acid ABC transporter substrate-binding protein (PAAT family) n=1 Tax=Aestuariispira insulae TaxID=1461337 RepID=A0A3D9HYP1_9PROT|nr:transporter substrate-binding domain-containing protein [Aestuariispira insulae]RED54026.1 amino acid ABC transporter substrate-binding protein (PAAT family) [Aestuariispira insulae]
MCLSILVATAAQGADQARTITISTGEYPPYASKEFVHFGLVPRIVSEAFASENIEVEYRFFPWARSYELSRDGMVDATAYWYYSKERQADHIYSDPLFEDVIVWFHRKDLDFQWKKLGDLTDYRIGAVNGYTYTPEFYALIKQGILSVEFVNRDQLNYRKLVGDRIDAFPETLDTGLYYIQSNLTPAQAAHITYHPQPFSKKRTFLLAPRIKPESAELIRAFNRGLARLIADGRFQQFISESRLGGSLPPIN